MTIRYRKWLEHISNIQNSLCCPGSLHNSVILVMDLPPKLEIDFGEIANLENLGIMNIEKTRPGE